MDELINGIIEWLNYFAMAIEIIIGAILGYFTLWLTFFTPSIDYCKENIDEDTKEGDSNGSQFLENNIHYSLYGYENAETFSNVSHPNIAINDDSVESISSKINIKCSNEIGQMQEQEEEEYLHHLNDIIVNVSNDEKTCSSGRNQLQRFDFCDENNGLIYLMSNDVNNEGIIKYLDGVCIPKISPNNLNLNLGNYVDDKNFYTSINLENISMDLKDWKMEEKFNESASADKECVFAATRQNMIKFPCEENTYDLTSAMIPGDKSISSIDCQLKITAIENDQKIENSFVISTDRKIHLKCDNEQVPEIVHNDATNKTLIKRELIDETEKQNSCDSTDDFKLQQNHPLNKELEKHDSKYISRSQSNFDFLMDKKQTNKFCKFKQAEFVKKPLEESTLPDIGVRDRSIGNFKEVLFMHSYPSRERFSKDLNEKVSRIEFGHTSKNTEQNICDIGFSSDSVSFKADSDVSFNSERNAPQFSKDPYESSRNINMEENQTEGNEIKMTQGNIDVTHVNSTFKKKCIFPKKLKNFFTKTLQKPFKSLRLSAKKAESQEKDPDLSLFNCEISSDKNDFTFEPGPLLLRYLNEDPFDSKRLEKRDEIHVSTGPNEYGASGQISECTRHKPCVINEKQRKTEIHPYYFKENEGKKIGVSRKRFEPKKWFMKKLTPHPAI